MRRARGAWRAGCAGLGLLAGLAPAAPATTPEPSSESLVWLELVAPADGEQRAGRVGWLEVRGWAGVGQPLRHDVIVVVDTSGSTIYASGVDVDGDGSVGRRRRRIDEWRTFNPRHYSSDLDDTILAAELVATRRLVALLDAERTRVGLVAFSGGAELLAPVTGGSDSLASALQALERNFGSGATNLAAAIEVAASALRNAGGDERRKSLLILSDGYPTAPVSAARGSADALARARDAAARGIRIHTFGLGLGEAAEGDVYAAVAEVSGGRYQRLAKPGEIVHVLPRVDLARVADVRIENRTSGREGQALRVFPDGSFDGYVRLAPGENRIRVTARGEAGGERSVERTVLFDRREPRSEAEARAFEEQLEGLRQALALRSLETELADEAAAARAAAASQRRELEVRVDGED